MKKGCHHTKESKQKLSMSRLESGLSKGKNNPNYGRKHTDEERLKISKSNKGKKLSLKHINILRELGRKRIKSIEERKKISKGLLGHPNHHPHKVMYKNIFFRSTWEVICAKWLDMNGYKWKYEPERFFFKDKNFTYLPDFFVEGVGYVEVKGWMWEDDKRRIDEFKKKHILFVIKQKEIEQMSMDLLVNSTTFRFSTLQLCLITPFRNLNESKINGDMFFALSRQLKENQEYYNFFKKMKKEGYEVCCDDNVHEKDEVDFEEHVKMALDVGTEIIIPDKMRDKKKTLEYFHYFMDKFGKQIKDAGLKLMAVPQGETFDEIMSCFDEMANDERVDIIGNSFDLVPFKLCNEKYKNQSMNRSIIMSEFLRRTKKYIHMLGSNNLFELYLFNKFPQVRSTDGKIFSRLALSNSEITDENWMMIQKPEIKMEFENIFTEEQEILYRKNIKFFKKLLG